MDETYGKAFGKDFRKKYQKAYKRHKKCFEQDWSDVERSIITNLSTPLQFGCTSPIHDLGEKYSELDCYKTRMVIFEVKKPAARVIWHPSHEKTLNHNSIRPRSRVAIFDDRKRRVLGRVFVPFLFFFFSSIPSCV